MQNHLFTKQRRKPGLTGFRGALAAMLLGSLLFATGARASGMSGTYTIDASGSGNYSTFKAAISDLASNGVSGPVVFNVTATTYTENVKIGAITGASSTNTITFRGKGRSSTILTSSGTTVVLNSYTTFDQMTISSSGSSNLIVANNTVACGFTNCNLTGTVNGSSYLISANSQNGFTLYNDEIYGGEYGIYMQGTNNSAAYGFARISHCRFVEQYYVGIYAYYDFKDSVAFNTIDSAGSSGYDYGVCILYTNGFIMWGNKVLVSAYYSYLAELQDYYPVSGKTAQTMTINNWFVENSGNGGTYSCCEDIPEYTPNYLVIANTFVNLAGGSYAVFMEPYQATNMVFDNNIIYNSASPSYLMYFYAYGASIASMDGNDYYSTGTYNYYFVYGSSGYSWSSFSGIVSGLGSIGGWETHATNTAPPFVSLSYPQDCHMVTTKPAPKGIAGTGITTDIDGLGRFPNPTVGACESLYGVVNNNAGVTALISPIAQCPGTATVKVQVSNLGLNGITSGTIAWTWNGTPQTSVSYSTSIAKYGQTTITLGTVTLTSGVSYAIKAWPTLTNTVTNAGGANDTLSVGGIMAALGSGTYTIDASKAASSTNFKSFTTAVTALNAGVCGPVVFNVSAATYSEALKIGVTGGASATNTITFNGAGRTKTTLTNSGVPITMSGSSYITFQNMTISTTGTGNVITEAGTTNCRIQHNNLTAPTYSSSSGSVVSSTGTNFNLIGNYIKGGYTTMNIGGKFDSIAHNRFIASGYYFWQTAGVGNVYQYNVIDSVADASPEYGVYSQGESGCTYDGNYFNFRDATGVPVNCYCALYLYNINSSATTISGQTAPLAWSFTNNIVQACAQEFGQYVYAYSHKAPIIWAFNTISYSPKGTGTLYYPFYQYMSYYNSAPDVWLNNVIMSTNAYEYGFMTYMYSPMIASGISNWDNGDTLFDGNDYLVTGTPYYLYYAFSGSTFSSTAAFLSAAKSSYNYERHGFNAVTMNFLNPSGNLYLDTTKSAITGVPFCTPATTNAIAFAGVNHDITGRQRCTLFPTVGAFEDPYGKAPKKTKIYVPASGVYPGSPATIYQSHTAGDPAIYVWYIENSNYSSWYPIGTSTDLYYSGWTTGTNQLKLVTQSCYGLDSDQVSFTVSAPTAVPVTDFIASANTIQQNSSVQFTDLSTNGPQKWLWAITPDSTTIGSTKVPTTTQYNGSPALNVTQNPSVQFLYPGFYKVCLTAYNGLGKGAIDCKTNYINVVPATNLSSTPQTVTTPTGYIYDNGGPGTGTVGNYTPVGSPYIQSILIQPCADSIYLTFSQFDTKCGTDYVRLYNGSTPSAKVLNTACTTNTGTVGTGPGFTGGPSNPCATLCIPNVNKPDTFKAGKTMLLQMACYTGGAPGFAAYYWVKPSSDTKVMPSFQTANGSDSVCAGQIVNWVNTTTINPADPPSFQWDLNGDLTDGFECTGTCATAIWPYFLPGNVNITLIATNCGGSDTLVKTITIISPPKPVAAFTASILAPTTSDIDVLTSGTVQCVDNYKWTITPSTGNTGGVVPTYVNNTTNTSASPQVTFADTGYYDVSLYVDNASATQTNTLTKTKYIHVRAPYCQPSVAQLSSGIGISQVVFNTINNYTKPQATQGYLNFTSNTSISTNIAIGASYTVTVARDASSIFSPINRDVYIDWNQDGYFTGTGELVAQDSNSTKTSFSATVKVPTTAKLGATVMRVAVNLYLYPNVPCGPNQFGQFEDYRVYVTPYNILPVITLKGVSTLQDTIKVEQGYPYKEPGDSASSYLYGDISKNIAVTSKIVGGTSSFNILVPGTYVFSYNVTDAAGNKAITKYRVVKVTPDKTPPALKVAKSSVSGTDTIYQEVSSSPVNLKPSLSSYVISSIDLVDGNLTSSVYIDSSLVQTTVVGVYPVTYSSTDISGNRATVTRYVDVIDTIKPILTLNGANPYTLEVYTPFSDPGVKITIPNNYLTPAQVSRYLHVVSSVDDSLLGTYKVTYSLTDTFGNKAVSVTRTVLVVDNIPPTLTLFGALNDSIPVFNNYVDPGYVFSDNYTKTANIKFGITGTFYTAFPGGKGVNKVGGGRYAGQKGVAPVYTIIYTATDGSGNVTSITRNVEVYDAIAPTIQLVGPYNVSVCRWFPYIDLGYTLSDNYEDSTSMVTNGWVKTLGDFTSAGGTSLPYKTLYLYYTAMDQSHNLGQSAVREIQVLPAGTYPCQSGIEPNLSLDKYITIFPNPSTGIFTLDANLPSAQNVRISVMNMLGQEIAVVHNGTLSNNSFRVDLSDQASGVYFLNIVTDNQTLTKRIEVSK